MSTEAAIRSDLDRSLLQLTEGEGVDVGQKVLIVCAAHKDSPTSALYQGDGHVRLLCQACGLEVLRVKVADQ